MGDVRNVFVEKKHGFDVEAKGILKDFQENLGIANLEQVRLVNKYTVEVTTEEYYKKTVNSILSEPMVDKVVEGILKIASDEFAFGVEFLPGQYDQRADSAVECYGLLTGGEKIEIKSAKVVILKGNLTNEDVEKIKAYYINPVDSREVDVNSQELFTSYNLPKDVQILEGFINMTEEELETFHKEQGLAMSIQDLIMVRDYFKSEDRNPTITEVKVIDTYWSDHCRHTTFATSIEKVDIEENKYTKPIKDTYEDYKKARKYVYGERKKDINLMDIAVIAGKELRKEGLLDDLDVSEEINACSIQVDIETDKGIEEYLVMFKNETHNHPTEIEPFGGAATCLGGAIRDPLSGRTYVYQAMRVTGCADPTVPVEETLKGKLSQRKITIGSAHGYSSYGNQIGLATGQVAEIYHDNYVAKRMEIGAVIAAAPKENVVREVPTPGDIVVLLGGKTGRDGCGGATGSSKEHTEDSINECGAEVQKGNPPTERKIQRLFRNKEVTTMIKRCNDFGAGGVSVAIGELCDGLDINLELVPKKYEGLDGTELSISESQERMAVVVTKENAEKFIALAEEENLEAVAVANVTDKNRLIMNWRGTSIVNLSRDFLNTNGATQKCEVKVVAPSEEKYFFNDKSVKNKKEEWVNTLKSLNVTSQKGLVERFDSTIGGGTVLMPFGGKYYLTPAEGMAAKIPVLHGESKDATLMSYGYNPYMGQWSPYHMAYYSVIESVAKIVAMGGDYKKIKLTFQEYFEKLGKSPERWGKPFAALLGGYRAQRDLNIAAIGGKDSMSGSFGEMDVPPTLVSFAVAVEKAERIISPEFKKAGNKIVYIKAEKNEDGLLNMDMFKKNMETIHENVVNGKIVSAYTIKFGGLAEGISKMSFGNKIGAKLLNDLDLFSYDYGSVIVELAADVKVEDLQGANAYVIGETTNTKTIEVEDFALNIDDLVTVWEGKLNTVFPIKTKEEAVRFDADLYDKESKVSPIIKVAKPKVVIPVFPGTNCEYDCERAFEKEGAEVKQVVLKNLSKEALLDSINELEKEIKKSQIIMLPGGFSAGDEPDGSGKFIATVFRNEKVKEAVMELLNNRDGLMIGICNGFQALVKLGLVPYGEIRDMEEGMPTLTYNNIGRHASQLVETKVVSKLSPWFNEVDLGSVHTIPISHGEGRFVATEDVLKTLKANGQIATQYVDMDGKVALDMPFNPNGSVIGIEGITSPDGRVLGKMGHSERIGNSLYKNAVGDFDQKLFKSGVKYFK